MFAEDGPITAPNFGNLTGLLKANLRAYHTNPTTVNTRIADAGIFLADQTFTPVYVKSNTDNDR
jgi:hypothetical protein